MATGDQSDFAGRLRATLPAGWFGGTSPVLSAVLGGWAAAWASLYALYAYVRLQARIATATGVFLDAIAVDFFGLTLARAVNETDTAFSARIRATLFQPQATRASVVAALVALTGRTPVVFEPANPSDTGGWSDGSFVNAYGLAWDTAGGWGELDLPFQFFLTAYRPSGGGVANVGGFYTGTGWAGGGWDQGAIEWISPDLVLGQVTDTQIQNAVNTTRPAASTAWMRITA